MVPLADDDGPKPDKKERMRRLRAASMRVAREIELRVPEHRY